MRSFVFSIMVLLAISTTYGQSQQTSPKLFKHMLVITFKANASADSISAYDKAFKQLARTVSVVKDYEWGIEILREKSPKQKHVYVLSFADKKDIDVYAATPEHKAIVELAKSEIESVSAIDYWVEK